MALVRFSDEQPEDAVKTRILFVDDDLAVLQGLQRVLRPMRSEWEMEYAQSGSEALERMNNASFDVIVADMRMHGMNGAELLNEVMKRHPNTVRLILSANTDLDLITKCVGSTHQFLTKPCDPETLKSTIRRASELKFLHSDSLRRLVAQMDRLPSLPSLYGEILHTLEDPEASLDDVAAVIARDIGMTANILKLANSTFFGLPRPVSSVADAASFLGLETIKSLVLSIQIFSQLDKVDVPGFSLDALLQHSFQIARAARAIAHAETASHQVVDESFVAGMLHDTGKLVLAANLSAQYQEVMKLIRTRNLKPFEAEMEVFGVTHADVGGYLFGLWSLPVPVVEAIALHHDPGRAADPSFSPLTAVHVADVLVNQETVPVGLPVPVADLHYLTRSGCGGRLAAWRHSIRQAGVFSNIHGQVS